MAKKQEPKGEPEQLIRIRDARTLPFFWIPRALLKYPKLTYRGIITYAALAYYADNSSATTKGIGIKQLGRIVKVSEDTIKRGLQELEKYEIIRVRSRIRVNPQGKIANFPNEYTLLQLDDPKP